jgi:hypothetical protein
MGKAQMQMILQTFITLMSSAFGLVAALAWNEAIKTWLEQWLGKDEGLTPLFLYAIIVTLVAIITVLLLARAAAKVGGEAAITREADL